MQDQRLCELLSHCFGCSAEDVRVIDAIEAPEEFDGCTVLVERHIRAGQFPVSLSVLSCPSGCFDSDTAVAMQLCNLAQCAALVSDSTVNPYNWVLLDGLGNQTEMLMDGDALDDHDAFVIPDARRPTWFLR